VPPVLAADASQAAKDATKVVEVVADAYDQKVLDYLAALGTYRDGLAT
jgi:hypothetical protein